METRPKLNIQPSHTDKVVELVTVLLLVILWISVIVGLPRLPDEIPSHFNATGKADDYSGKASIFMLPVIATILYVGMTLLNKHPHIYNYPTTVNSENAARLYTSATRLIRFLKLVVVIIFTAIVFMTYKVVFDSADGIGVWFLPVAIGVLVLPVIYFLFNKK